MRFINLTGGHDISFYSENQCVLNETTKKLVVKEGEMPYMTLPCVGCVRASRTATVENSIEVNGHTVNLNRVSYGEPSGLPEVLEEDTLYVVSFIAHCAIKQHMGDEYSRHFVIIDGLVSGPDGKPCGCTALSVG